MSHPSPRGLARRSFLRSLFSLAALALLPGGAAAASPTARALRLEDAERAMAALAAGFWRERPRAARRVCRDVEAELALACRTGASLPEKARLARERLLGGERVAAELAHGDVVILGGWVLARSEASLAIYLQGLASA